MGTNEDPRNKGRVLSFLIFSFAVAEFLLKNVTEEDGKKKGKLVCIEGVATL